jgi:hypothetical protein
MQPSFHPEPWTLGAIISVIPRTGICQRSPEHPEFKIDLSSNLRPRSEMSPAGQAECGYVSSRLDCTIFVTVSLMHRMAVCDLQRR